MSALEVDGIELESVRCDLCGSNERRELYRKPDVKTWATEFEFPVVECLRCGLVWVDPRPTQAAMARFYREGYHDGRASERHVRRYALQLGYLPPARPGARWLDVGCARGDFLSYALDRCPGIEAHGVDAFSDGVVDARIRFAKATLLERGFPAASFDLVTAWAVFEHLHAPDRHFAEIARILVPGGRFVFLVTNSDSLYGRRAYREDVPRHTYHYSPAVLRLYAAKHGFEIARLVHDDRIFDGRGKGTFQHGIADALGVTWRARRERRLTWPQRIALRTGKTLDRIAFATHWEARLARSGIVVAEFVRPAGPAPGTRAAPDGG